MTTRDPKRQPAGIVTGGQFATQPKAEPDVALVSSPKQWRADTVEQAFGELTEPPRPDQRPSVDVKGSVAAMRSDLRSIFDNHKFSVRMASGTAYGWASVSWDDGPRPADVDAVTNGYCSSRFDGMDDSYHQVNQDAPVRWGLCGVNTSRGIGADGQRHIDDIFERAGLSGYQRLDAKTGERSTYDGGYDGTMPLREEEIARVERLLDHPIPGRYNSYRAPSAAELAHIIQAHTTYKQGVGTTDLGAY